MNFTIFNVFVSKTASSGRPFPVIEIELTWSKGNPACCSFSLSSFFSLPEKYLISSSSSLTAPTGKPVFPRLVLCCHGYDIIAAGHCRLHDFIALCSFRRHRSPDPSWQAVINAAPVWDLSLSS
jgi:hypothetical protein